MRVQTYPRSLEAVIAIIMGGAALLLIILRGSAYSAIDDYMNEYMTAAPLIKRDSYEQMYVSPQRSLVRGAMQHLVLALQVLLLEGRERWNYSRKLIKLRPGAGAPLNLGSQEVFKCNDNYAVRPLSQSRQRRARLQQACLPSQRAAAAGTTRSSLFQAP
jgi:hypothetical protein